MLKYDTVKTLKKKLRYRVGGSVNQLTKNTTPYLVVEYLIQAVANDDEL